MPRKYAISFGVIVFCFLCASCFDPNFPYLDDPTTVGNFKSSKFDGFWERQDLEPGQSSGVPILDYEPMLYVFRKNTMQSFGCKRDWDELSEMNMGEKAQEFLYSNTVIYTEEFFNTREWVKTPYKLSSDGNEMTFGWRNYQLKKITVEWKKEDIFGSWYNYNVYSGNPNVTIYYEYTFNENSLVFQYFKNGIPDGESYNTKITLTDKYYKEGKETYYYCIIDNKLLLSTGTVYKRDINSE